MTAVFRNRRVLAPTALSWLVCVAATAMLCSAAEARSPQVTRAMQRVPLTRPVKDVLSDGQRYIIWGRRFTSQVTVFDAVTEKQRVIQLPAGCRQSHGIGQAAAGLLILYCRQGAEYGVELRTGRARRFGVGFPTYTNSGVGTRW